MARKNKNKTAAVSLISENSENTVTQEIATPETKKPVVKVGFDTWFSIKQANSTTKPWQRLEILTFFKKQGLADEETLNTYENTFKNF